jgi:hypothetical protein
MILRNRTGSTSAPRAPGPFKARPFQRAGLFLGMTDMTRIRTALLATALTVAGSAAFAQQGGGPSFEANVVGGLLSGLGLVETARPPIDYRERAPLVLPRGNALPPPQESAAARNPNWPNDPDVARARAAGLAANTPIQRDEFGRTMTNAELRARQGGWFGGGSVDTTRDRSQAQISGPATVDEMRVAPIWSQVGSLFGGSARDNQVVPFPGEPTRRRLVEPPPGYRTASPDAPYGPVGRRPDDPQAPNARSSSGQDPAGPRN